MMPIRIQLQKECARALQNYVRTIEEGCKLLIQVKEGLLPNDQREKIFAHRKQELLAYAAYTRAHRRVWAFLTDSDPRLTRLPDVLPGEENSTLRFKVSKGSLFRRMG
jgi:hypothetical protein